MFKSNFITQSIYMFSYIIRKIPILYFNIFQILIKFPWVITSSLSYKNLVPEFTIINFPFLLNLRILFYGETFRMTLSTSQFCKSHIPLSIYVFCLVWLVFFSSKQYNFSVICCTNSWPINLLPSKLSQQLNDVYLWPYNASNAAIPIVKW